MIHDSGIVDKAVQLFLLLRELFDEFSHRFEGRQIAFSAVNVSAKGKCQKSNNFVSKYTMKLQNVLKTVETNMLVIVSASIIHKSLFLNR